MAKRRRRWLLAAGEEIMACCGAAVGVYLQCIEACHSRKEGQPYRGVAAAYRLHAKKAKTSTPAARCGCREAQQMDKSVI